MQKLIAVFILFCCCHLAVMRQGLSLNSCPTAALTEEGPFLEEAITTPHSPKEALPKAACCSDEG